MRQIRFWTLLTGSALTGPAFAAPPEFHNEVQSDNPILWYQLNEATGNALNYGSLGPSFDAGYNGTPNRNVPTNTGDGGVGFDGIDDFLESLSVAPASLGGNPTFTAEAIVYFTPGGATLGYGTFLHWGDGVGQPGGRTGREVYFSISNNTTRGFAGFYNGGLRTVSPLQTGTWNHIVWVRTGGGNAQMGSKLFVNAVEVPVQADTVLCCNNLTPDVVPAEFRINIARDLTRWFAGAIDEVVLYDYELTADDVCRHHAAFYQPIAGDMNCDSIVSVSDIGAFVLALTNPTGYEQQFPCCNIMSGDVNEDGFITVSDIGPFVALLTN
ncbi:MAG: LamG-like jellyroll fold domain-containing protein [Phycisphaerae bacterium]